MNELRSGKSNWKADLEIPEKHANMHCLKTKLGPITGYKPDCLYGSTVMDWRTIANLLVQEAEHEENREK